LAGGLTYATGLADADCSPKGGGEEEDGYEPVFDGKTLDGWKQAGPGEFTVDNGELTTTGGMGLLWYEAKELSSYSLKLDWKMRG
ncbi:DUF1080 domain-containing protein, partial [Streptomyces fulvissimus]